MFIKVLSLMADSGKARMKGNCGTFVEVNVAAALSSAWACGRVVLYSVSVMCTCTGGLRRDGASPSHA